VQILGAATLPFDKQHGRLLERGKRRRKTIEEIQQYKGTYGLFFDRIDQPDL